MTIGEAVATFNMIRESDKSVKDKREAIRIVVDMATHNGIGKQAMLNAMRWMLETSDVKMDI